MLSRWAYWGCALVLACTTIVITLVSVQNSSEADALNAEFIRLYEMGALSKAVPVAEKVLALRERALFPRETSIATALKHLGRVYKSQGRYTEAEVLYSRSLVIREKALGPTHFDVASVLNDLASLHQDQGRYAAAEALYKRCLEISEMANGLDAPAVAPELNNLASLYQKQGRYAEAELIMRRSLAIYQKVDGPTAPSVAIALSNIASIYSSQGRDAEAEPLYKRSLALAEDALGPDHLSIGTSLNNLAGVHERQDRHAEAEPLCKRTITILQNALGPDHPSVATALNNLASVYRGMKRYSEAEPLLNRAISIMEKVLGPDHPDIATPLNNLATNYRVQGRFAEAEPLNKRAIKILEKAFGPDHPDVATALSNLGGLYLEQSRYEEAKPLFERDLAISEEVLGQDHPTAASPHNALAWLALARNDWTTAAKHWRAGATVLQRRAERNLDNARDSLVKDEAQRHNWFFKALAKTTHRLTAISGEEAERRAAEMFQTAQWGQSSQAGTSVAQMAARSASGKPELAALVRERQDLVAEWGAKDKLLIAAKIEAPAKRNPSDEKTLSDRLVAIEERLAAIDTRFARELPDYAALASPKPVSVPDVQANLRADEALVLFLDTDARFKPLPEETFVWVVTKSEVRWLRSEFGTEALAREVAALRCGLDGSTWHDKGSQRCTTLLGLDAAPHESDPLPFDAARAHALYKSLLGEAADLIKDKHLLVVPSGALTTLPFQVLVTEPPKTQDLGGVRWLIHDNPLTVLPSVAALKSLRRTGKPSAAERPMIGFANPLLDGDQAHPEHGSYYKQQAAIARDETGCAKAEKPRTAVLRVARRSLATIPLSGSRTADLAHLLMQAPLPETADEICEVARSVGADVTEMRIGARATETDVKRLSTAGELAKYRVLHFATHGTLAGQLKGTTEPGLILTPPSIATAEDDGYLSGSEIASLKLDADWVILSACNTAGGAGQGEAAEALSGLARVFFYSGARALLVSHWEVDSDAAVKLVTGTISALARDEEIGRAEAMRRAVLSVMADTSRPKSWVPASHPSVWAPFVVVGEGGAAK